MPIPEMRVRVEVAERKWRKEIDYSRPTTLTDNFNGFCSLRLSL